MSRHILFEKKILCHPIDSINFLWFLCFSFSDVKQMWNIFVYILDVSSWIFLKHLKLVLGYFDPQPVSTLLHNKLSEGKDFFPLPQPVVDIPWSGATTIYI